MRIQPEQPTAAATIEDTGAHRTSVTRVAITDAHPLVRWALTQIAQSQHDMVVVGEGATTNEALALAYSCQPAVMTIACESGDGDALDGWSVAEQLRRSYNHLGVVLLGPASDGSLFRALNVGASAYVPRSAPIPDVVAAIRHAAAAPNSFTAAGLADALRRRQHAAARTVLSAREREILLLLHEGMSVPAIAARMYVSLSTAKTYVARLYDKLGARNRAQALMAAVRMGLLDEQVHAIG